MASRNVGCFSQARGKENVLVLRITRSRFSMSLKSLSFFCDDCSEPV